MKWIHLSHDLQEVYSTSIPVDFVSRVSFLDPPDSNDLLNWTSSPSWPSSPSSPYRLSWHILTILTILTVLPAFENDLIWCSFRPLLVWSASLSRTFQGLWDMLAGSPGETVLFSVGSPPLSGFRVGFPVGMHFRMEHPVDLGSGQQFRQPACWLHFLLGIKVGVGSISWRQRLVPSIGSLWTALTRLKMVVVKHSWFKFGQTGDSLFLQVPQLGWFLCSWTVLFKRFQQTVSSSLFLWYWICVVICGGAFFPRIPDIQEMNGNGRDKGDKHLFDDLQEVYSTSIPVDFVSRVSFLAHPCTPDSDDILNILTILTILTTLTIPTILTYPHHPDHPDRPASFWEWSHLMFIPPAACMIPSLPSFTSRTFQVLWNMLAGSPEPSSFQLGLRHRKVCASGFP